jgi:uncharacterized repeat protein (TIGR01451 family)
VDWNGALPAPTLANIDADPDLEVVLMTAHSGVVAYDLPGTEHATVLWGTGRGNYQREGNQSNAIQPTLQGSSITSSLLNASPGDVLIFTITLRNPGMTISLASMVDTLPSELTFAGNLWTSSGIAGYSAGTIAWDGAVPQEVEVIIRFDATVDAAITSPTLIRNTAIIADDAGHSWQRESRVYIFSSPTFMPLIYHR